ncbi:MAG: DUF3078 domain-containing protein [Candidatus Hatepunaea meridiana]|nr:DUF3078 domain-containing protein [Candidatus Hatepunaea meridiana]
MQNLTITTICLLLLTTLSFGQGDTERPTENKWNISADISLTHTQNAYSDNWEGDESGNINWAAIFSFIAEKQLSERLNSRSTIRLEYGQTQTQDSESNNWSHPEKSTDKVDLESVLRLTFDSWVDPYIAGRTQSQFTDRRGRDTDIYFNPVEYTESFGIARNHLKNDTQQWISRLGLGSRQKIDRNALLIEAMPERGKKTISDAGLEFVSELNTPLLNNKIKLTAKFTAFQAFVNSEMDDLEGSPNEDYWRATDIDFETMFSANITNLIMVNLNLRWLYDKEVDLGGRFKETFSLGLTYTFI